MSEQKNYFRAFFAIDIPLTIRGKIEDLIKQLKENKRYSFIKWVKPENLHLTLRFLGNIYYTEYQDLVFDVAEQVKHQKPFIINFTSLTLFPNPHKPIAVALMPEPIEPLLHLNQAVEIGIGDYHVKKENKLFVPHLTIGRIKTRRIIDLPKIDLPKVSYTVNHIKLFRSETFPEGPEHFALVCLSLK